MKDIKTLLKEKYSKSNRDIILDGADFVSQKGFTIIPNYVLGTDTISAYAKLVYTMLLSYAWGDKNAAYPGQERLAKDCGISTRTVVRAMQELEENRFLTVARRGRGLTNLYVLRFKRRRG